MILVSILMDFFLIGNSPGLPPQPLLKSSQPKQFGKKKKENLTKRTQELKVKYLFTGVCTREKSPLQAQGEVSLLSC